MSQRESISRCVIIIKHLLKGPASYNGIERKLRMESEIRGYNFVASKRTFQRDVNDIREIFGISISYSFSARHYIIENNLQPEITERIIESFETYSLLNIHEDLKRYLQFESRRAGNNDMIPTIIKGIRLEKSISFTYKKFHEEITTSREVEPLGIKEFRNRYYLVATDLKDLLIKTFALDRINDPEITEKGFKYPDSFVLSSYFKDCFGIVRPEEDEPEEVLLSFNALQGKYIKSLPVHSSQVVISETKKEVRVRLRLYITHDFIMELLSYGDSVRVSSPDTLISEIKKISANTLKLYKE